jgi:cobalamin biosynthesis Mg chelatase CobN
MNYYGKKCSSLAAVRRRSSCCRGASAVHRPLQLFSGCFLLLFLVPAVGYGKIAFKLPFAEEKRIWGKNEGSPGYLRHQSVRQVPLVEEAEAQAENARADRGMNVDSATFRGFLEQMEAQLAAEKEAAEAEKSGEAEASARSETAQSKSGDGSTSEQAETQGASAMRRTTISSTGGGADAESAYIFPRPESARDQFEDIFLYFPVESGDLQKIGLSQEAGSGSRFTPPRPSGLKSRAIFEQIER